MINIKRELVLSWKFISKDLSASLYPSTVCFLAGLTHGVDDIDIIFNYFIVYSLIFYCYIYNFCLLNQITGVDEDMINKPDRPLPSKLTTIKASYMRYFICLITYICLAYYVDKLLVGLCWIILGVIYNVGGLDKHWFGKNCIFISLGTFLQLIQAWPSHVYPLIKISYISLSFGVTCNIQDFRDILGDQKKDRKTLIVLYGDSVRYYVSILVLCLPILSHIFLFDAIYRSLINYIIEFVLVLMNILVAYRLIKFKSPKDDHKTYIYHTYWFCGTLLALF